MPKGKQGQKAPPPRVRYPSASEIARNVANFEIWSSYQGCEQATYSDLPKSLKGDVDEVFEFDSRLPREWIDKSTDSPTAFSAFVPPEILTFIQDIYEARPSLFSADVGLQESGRLYAELVTVHLAWKRLQRMRSSEEKWSEADFVANVYNVLRSPALQESTHRVHCTISLPQPMSYKHVDSSALRILNTKTIVPDCGVFLPSSSIRHLSHSAKSPFKLLKRHPSVKETGSAGARTSFRYQSTPCAQLPDTPGFEIASSFWEDKKPTHNLLEDAYRQNRMSTTSAVRQLHSLHVDAPVFGLVWSNATVRAHVDWCRQEKSKKPVIFSAPYPGKSSDESHAVFHEWALDKPSDMFEVFILIKNIDRWTVGRFLQRVDEGVNDLLVSVVKHGQKYHPWRRDGNLVPPPEETIGLSITTASSGSGGGGIAEQGRQYWLRKREGHLTRVLTSTTISKENINISITNASSSPVPSPPKKGKRPKAKKEIS